jgi:hypothetical protein
MTLIHDYEQEILIAWQLNRSSPPLASEFSTCSSGATVRIQKRSRNTGRKLRLTIGVMSNRDCFDIEFLLRRGIVLPAYIDQEAGRLLEKIDDFKDRDFKVKLGSILESKFREYYVIQRFSYLKERLSSVQSDRRT